MAPTQAELYEGPRLTELIGLGVVQATFPLSETRAALAASGRGSRRQRLLPAQVVVYYVIALGLLMQVSCQAVLRCLLEGLQWCCGSEQMRPLAGESGISLFRPRDGLDTPAASAQTRQRAPETTSEGALSEGSGGLNRPESWAAAAGSRMARSARCAAAT